MIRDTQSALRQAIIRKKLKEMCAKSLDQEDSTNRAENTKGSGFIWRAAVECEAYHTIPAQ